MTTCYLLEEIIKMIPELDNTKKSLEFEFIYTQ